ncbi:YcbK family protein [Paenirhodobacter populi]|uniref:YcbK family protein n=1 Tax=Paenirhodobacter populi TaxID=2306993 RepID=UPI000FE3F67C|nr:D-Ala-D-Ala carboxypeptidase family metallohydrolase [Sinirhodobacter populi]RWR09698.1 DUF882 domain-containing protein [Sinirhodobacter populi]
MKIYSHWSGVPASEWFWPSFTAQEIACRGTGKVGIDPEAMDKLQALRDRLGVPVILNSAYRSPEHNAAVGGASDSLHMQGKAFDVSMVNHDPDSFEVVAREVGFTGFGFYPRANFMHIDTGAPRDWGTRWPEDHAATRFSEVPKVAERPGADRVVKGLAAALAGVLAAAPAFVESLGKLDPLAQVVAIGGGVLLAGALAYLVRDRLRKWLR